MDYVYESMKLALEVVKMHRGTNYTERNHIDMARELAPYVHAQLLNLKRHINTNRK